MTDRVGQQLGNYRLIRLLGQGDFAQVYLGYPLRRGSLAAIKVFHNQLPDEDMDQFRTQAQTLVRLEHPHIARVLEFGFEEKRPFLVMDYAPGGTVRQHHPEGRQLPLGLVVYYVNQIADALQFAHNAKVIHQNIQPENMLLGRHNKLLLSDFRIAIVAQRSNSQGTHDMAGTIAYMAPEQIQGHPQPASDQYALGIVVYEWLSGELPFQGSSAEMAFNHAIAPPPPLREALPSISPEVEQVVLRALEKDPHRRFATVGAFAAALAQASHIPSSSSVSILSAGIPPKHLSPPTQTDTASSSNPSPSEVTSSHPLLHSRDVIIPSTSRKLQFPGRRLSRRTIIVSLAGLAAAGIVGSGLTWLARSHSSGSPTTLGSTPTADSTPIPLGTLLYTYHGHIDEVHAVAWSPDGKRIASASYDQTVQVWNVTDGSQTYIYRGHTDKVDAVAWSPDGRRIASGSWDKTVQVWNATDGSQMFIYQGHALAVTAVAWSPDGKWIASASSDQSVQVWNATDGSQEYTYQGHTDEVGWVGWSPDGKRIASSSWDTTVQVWSATDGSQEYTYRGHTKIVYSAAWSPDGKRIASASADGTVQVWNASDGSQVFTYYQDTGEVDVNAVAWSPDGKRIASAGLDETVQVWNASDGSQVFTYRGHFDVVDALAWSPDGKRIASGSWDKTVQIWSGSTTTPGYTSTPTHVPLGTLLYTYPGHTDNVDAVAWSPDGKRIASASGDGTVQVWNATDGSQKFTYHGHTSAVNAVAWSPDGKRIASGSWDKTVQVWNATDGNQAYTYRGHTDIVDAVAWSPDGKLIASGSWDRTVQVWNATDGSQVFTYQGHTFTVAWSPDGKHIASGSYQTVQVWNATDGSQVFTYQGHTRAVYAVGWSPDGKRIASGSLDKTAQVWNATDGAQEYTYQGHTSAVTAVAWSPDSKRIASGGADSTVQVWNATDGGQEYTYHRDLYISVDALAWSPDGMRIASSASSKVQVWQAS